MYAMDALDKHLFDLRTISSVPPGKRISTAKEFLVVDEDRILQPFYRWWVGDSRIKAAQVITNCFDTVMLVSNLMIATLSSVQVPEQAETIKKLKEIGGVLSDAEIGVGHLMATYHADANMLAHLEPIPRMIKEHIAKINMVLAEHGESVTPSRPCGHSIVDP